MPTYRLILEGTDPTVGTYWATGATYPGCERVLNPTPCDGQSFFSLQEAIDYAKGKGEIPVKVSTLQDVDDILAGTKQITDDMILNGGGGIFGNISTPVLVGGGLLILMMLSRPKRGNA